MTDNEAIKEFTENIRKEHRKLEEYEAIGTVEELREVLKMQRAWRPNSKVQTEDLRIGGTVFKAGTKTYWCPNCNNAVTRSDRYCRWCGQKLDWSK